MIIVKAFRAINELIKNGDGVANLVVRQVLGTIMAVSLLFRNSPSIT